MARKRKNSGINQDEFADYIDLARNLERHEQKAWSRTKRQLKVGSVIEARVTRLSAKGAVIDIGDGAEGLVHVSDMIWARGRAPSTLFRVGSQIRVVVRAMNDDLREVTFGLEDEGGNRGRSTQRRASQRPSKSEPIPATAAKASALGDPGPDLSKILTLSRAALSRKLIGDAKRTLGKTWQSHLKRRDGALITAPGQGTPFEELDWPALNALVHALRRLPKPEDRTIDISQFKMFMNLKEFRDTLDQHKRRKLLPRDLLLAGADAVALLESLNCGEQAALVEEVLEPWKLTR